MFWPVPEQEAVLGSMCLALVLIVLEAVIGHNHVLKLGVFRVVARATSDDAKQLQGGTYKT